MKIDELKVTNNRTGIRIRVGVNSQEPETIFVFVVFEILQFHTF